MVDSEIEDNQQGKYTSRNWQRECYFDHSKQPFTTDMIDKCLDAYSLECSWQGKGY